MVFGRPWSPLSYAITGEIGGLFALDRDDQFLYATMLALALPFLVVGLVLTVRRLRDAGWPIWLAAIFFAPMPINVVFFVVLCLVPSRTSVVHGTLDDIIDAPGALKPKLMDTRPRIAYPWAIAAILIPKPVAAAVVYFGTHILNDYGWSLFIGLPFVLPMVSVVIYGAGREVTQGQCLCGSTLYHHGLWPASYWRLWSDPIIHRIHDRVLRHIKTLTESPEPRLGRSAKETIAGPDF